MNFWKCANLRFYFHIYFEDWTSNSQHHIVIIRRVEEDQHYGASERPKPVCELDLAGAPLLPYLQLHCCQLAGAARHIWLFRWSILIVMLVQELTFSLLNTPRHYPSLPPSYSKPPQSDKHWLKPIHPAHNSVIYVEDRDKVICASIYMYYTIYACISLEYGELYKCSDILKTVKCYVIKCNSIYLRTRIIDPSRSTSSITWWPDNRSRLTRNENPNCLWLLTWDARSFLSVLCAVLAVVWALEGQHWVFVFPPPTPAAPAGGAVAPHFLIHRWTDRLQLTLPVTYIFIYVIHINW